MSFIREGQIETQKKEQDTYFYLPDLLLSGNYGCSVFPVDQPAVIFCRVFFNTNKLCSVQNITWQMKKNQVLINIPAEQNSYLLIAIFCSFAFEKHGNDFAKSLSISIKLS